MRRDDEQSGAIRRNQAHSGALRRDQEGVFACHSALAPTLSCPLYCVYMMGTRPDPISQEEIR